MPNDERLLDERGLVDLVVAGNPAAAHRFAELFLPVAYRALRPLLRVARHEVDDLAQDLFVRLARDDFRRLRLWDGRASLATYIAVCARNLGRDYLRTRRRRAEEVLNTDRLAPDVDSADDPQPGTDLEYPNPDPLERLHNEELSSYLGECIATLSERDQMLIKLRRIEDLPAAEVGRLLDMAPNAVGVAVHRAQKRLINCLKTRHPDIFSGQFGENNGERM